MKLLLLTSRFPWPPDRGDRLAVFNLLRTLAPAHQVTLASFTDGSEPPEAFEEVGRHCARVETVRLPRMRSWAQAWAGLPFPSPSQVSFYRSSRMRARVRALLAEERHDVVFAHLIRMAPYAAELDHPAKVLWLGDSLGMALGRSGRFAPWWQRPGVAWERRRVDRFSARSSLSFAETWALSPVDRDDLVRIGCARVVLVPHGIDERLFDVARLPDPEPLVMFLGNLSVPHNIDAARFAAEEVWPRLRAARPGARLVLAGASPVPAVRRLAAADVEVPGSVPDLRALWARAHVLLAPLRFSTGIQNKVLEAMAAGVPVVTTPPVIDGIGARGDEHALLATDAAGLAQAVERTLADPEAAAERCRRARAHVREHFSWMTAVRRLEEVAAAAGRGGTGNGRGGSISAAAIPPVAGATGAESGALPSRTSRR